METFHEIVCLILFIFEGFFALANIHIALSFRSLPLKDMARLQYFFLCATLTVATTEQAILNNYWMLDIGLLIHHLYCYLTWNNSSYTKKLILWSSLNWTGSKLDHIPFYLGSLCFAFLHGYHAYLLAHALDMKLLIFGLIGVHSAIMAVMYNSKLAWASPRNIPDWVAKRIEDSKKSIKHD